MDGATETLVRIAWARVFGLADDVFAGSACRVGVTSAAVVMTVRFWDYQVICAPASVLRRAVELAERERLTTDAMLSLAGPHGRFLGQADLAYTGRPVKQDRPFFMKYEIAAAREIERECSPEEVAEAGLSTMDHLLLRWIASSAPQLQLATRSKQTSSLRWASWPRPGTGTKA